MKKEIPAFYNPSTYLHKPEYEVFNAEKKPHNDKAERVDVIISALRSAGFVDIQISSQDPHPVVVDTHDADFLDYLKDASLYARSVSEKRQIGDFAIYPSIHPYAPYAKASNMISKRGDYVYDTYTPIMKDTYQIALDSAGVALAGAMLLKAGEPLVYGLSRPSGHHALRRTTGGMCYINNAAVAVNFLINRSNDKAAILDIDFHHGNGTQDIFYDNPNVLVINIHGDPRFTYPHFTGYENEIGKGEGLGTNHNFPLPPKTNDHLYNEYVDKALKLIGNFDPKYLVVSAGFDTHKDDPCGNFKLTTPYYKKLGEKIKKLDLPVLVIQEGGYASANLGLNVTNFLDGLRTI